MSPARDQAPSRALDPARVHAWRLDRQLLGRSRAASPSRWPNGFVVTVGYGRVFEGKGTRLTIDPEDA